MQWRLAYTLYWSLNPLLRLSLRCVGYTRFWLVFYQRRLNKQEQLLQIAIYVCVCVVYAAILVLVLLLFLFKTHCLRWGPSITKAFQTSAQFSKSMAHWLPQQQTWTHVCLPDSYKKETRIQIGLHCLPERTREYVNDNHDINPSLILKNTFLLLALVS